MRLFGKKKPDQPKVGRERAKPHVNEDADLVKREKQQIRAFSQKRFWLKTQKFGW